MRIFVTGACGQLGHDVVNEAASRGYEPIASDITPEYSGADDGSFAVSAPYLPLDITDETAVQNHITELHPDVIIHCGAWTAVDTAEDEENRPKVFAVNAGGTRNIARTAKNIGAKIVYLSTDYVFNGEGTRPWEADDQCCSPLNIYGQSKLEGELAVRESTDKFFIVRTSWVFGLSGNNFVKTILRVGKSHLQVRVVSDQIGTPTYTPDLARILLDMAETEKYGIYHVTNSETEKDSYISWFDFTEEIYKQAGLDTEVIPVTTSEYGLSKARRPFNSRMDKQKLIREGFTPLPDWKDALHRYLMQIGEIKH